MQLKPKSNRIFQILQFVIVFISFQLLGTVYFGNQSLFLDELNLARNIIELSFSDYFGALNYGQFAPPLYLALVKSSILMFGKLDIIFRLPSFLAAIGSLLIFYRISNKLFTGFSLCIALIMFGWSTNFIIHASEVKQYAMDLFIALSLVGISFAKIHDERKLLILAIVGAFSIWISMPSIFVFFGLGVGFLWNYRSEKALFIKTILVGVVWAISFSVFYFGILHHAVQSDYLQNYHQAFYLGRNGNTVEQINGIISNVVDKTFVPVFIFLVFFCLGLVGLYRSNKKLFLIWVLPIIATLLASFLKQYSIISRLMLFLLPFFIWIMVYGVQLCLSSLRWTKVVKWIVQLSIFLMLLVTIINKGTFDLLVKPYVRENSKKGVEFLSQNGNELPVYYTYHAVPSYEYYNKLSDYHFNIQPNVYLGRWEDDLSQLSKTWIEEGIDKIWIFDAHTFGEEKVKLNAQISNVGNVLVHKKFKACDVILVSIRNVD